MKALKITIAGLVLSGFATAQVKDTVYILDTTRREAPRYAVTPTPPPPAPVEKKQDEEPDFKGGEFGVRYMPSYSLMDFKTVNGSTKRGEFVIGHGVGAFIGINSKHVGLQLEVIYNALSQKYKDNTVDRTVKMNYINIPLLVTFNTNRAKPVNFQLAVGPQLGISVGSKLESSGAVNNNPNSPPTDTVQAVLAVKKSDFGVAYGAGFDFALIPSRLLRLGVGFRGVLGLVDISDKSGTTVNKQFLILDRTMMQTYSAYIGLSFMF